MTARDAHSGSLLATLVVAFAARARIPAPAKNPAPALVFGGAELPSELKLDPSLVKAIKLGSPPTAADEVDVAVANVKTEAERVKTAIAYEATGVFAPAHGVTNWLREAFDPESVCPFPRGRRVSKAHPSRTGRA